MCKPDQKPNPSSTRAPIAGSQIPTWTQWRTRDRRTMTRMLKSLNTLSKGQSTRASVRSRNGTHSSNGTSLRVPSRIRLALRILRQINMRHDSTKWAENSRQETPIRWTWLRPAALSTNRAVVIWCLNRWWRIALAQSNPNPPISPSWAETSSRACQRRSARILALAATCTTSSWKIRCERWVSKCASATKWILSAQAIRASSTKNRQRSLTCRQIWTMAWYRWRIRRSWRNGSLSRRP